MARLATLFLSVVLLQAAPAIAELAPALTVYFYHNGQATPVTRPGTLSGNPQTDAVSLLSALLAGPTADERASGLISPLPSDAELVVVTVVGDEVTVDLLLPLSFLHDELDPDRSDAIVEQIVKTLYPLDLHVVHVRAKDGFGDAVPLSDFLPRPPVIVPTVPTNDDAAPDRPGLAPKQAGQPPIFGQGQPQGALSGKTVWLSAGHGWYWSSVLNRWTTQRGNNHGLVEDFSNAEAVNYYLTRYLWNAGAEVWLVRDRAMIEHEIIVDNDEGAPAYSETGAWLTSSTPGYGGSTYRWANTSSTMSASATWTPDLPEAGWYGVWAWYRHGTNRPTDARYEIRHLGGVTPVSISQEVHGQTWRYLGEYYFEAGNSRRVTLLNTSSDPDQAVVADAIRFGGGLGSIPEPSGRIPSMEGAANGSPSGRPRWEEAAKYWVRYQGAPLEIATYDSTSRPLYAEWETAKGYPGEAKDAVYISWHTNAGGGTGTVSYIHNTEPTPGSAELQDWIHAELIRDLRADWNPNWVDRGKRRADFGEVRELSTIAGVLLEVAFHDTEDPGDADDLREPVFRQIAARAVYQGTVKYFAERDGDPIHLLPEPPTHLVVRTTGPGHVTLTWAAGGDAATSYKVYQSAGGRAFDNGAETTGITMTLTGLDPGTLRFFRVTALGEGGESFPTPVVAVRTPVDGGAASFLILDGFDRLDQAAMVPQWEAPFLGTDQRMFLERMNRYNYSVEHGQALSACGLAFDGAVNEAVESGDVSLNDYAAVDWLVGEDSVADAALSDAERARLVAYLDGGGKLLISGAEIGYDLVENHRDPAFYRDYLRARYLGDDAGTYDFAGVPGGPFSGLASSFDDGSGGTYDVGYPDRLAAAPGATVVLTYDGGTRDGAAVAYDGTFRVMHFGFPLEAVTDPAVRTALFCRAADYLLPPKAPNLTFLPHRSGMAEPGETAVYTHTLTNLGGITDTFRLSHTSSQGWGVAYSSPITLDSGLGTTLAISVTVPADAFSGTVDTTVLTATSQNDPSVSAAVTDTTTVQRVPSVPCTQIPRLINPGFEQGAAQSAWVVDAPDGVPVLAHRDNLPGYIEPHGGDWLASLGVHGPTITGPVTDTITILTQAVALPSGEPTATLTLAWFVHPETPSPYTDTLSVGIYDMSGTLQADALTITNHSPTDTWQTAEFDMGAFAGQTVQLSLRAVTSATTFFVDDVDLTTCGPRGPDEFRALWVDAYHNGIKNRTQINELVETAQAGNFNALVVQVRRRGDTYYPSELDPWARDANPDFDALAYLIERAHAVGIEVHAWATTLAIWNGASPPASPEHAFNLHGPGHTGRDYWLMTSYSGDDGSADKAYYLDPGHPDAADYTVAVYAELAGRYDLDGLHLDRIRYPWRTWGYNANALSRFHAQTGRDDLPEPDDDEWLRWRRDQVTALVRKIYLTATAINPRLRISAALSASGGPPSDDYPWETRTPYTHQLQDWRGWLEEGLLDLGLSMTYRDEDTYAGPFDGWIAWQKDHQYGRGTVVGTGLYLNSVGDSLAQWGRVRQPSALGNQALGVSGYSYATPSDAGISSRAFVNAAVTEVFTQPASGPDIPWKDSPTLGHLMGSLAPTPPCLPSVDGHSLKLTGPQTRTLQTDGSGWFGVIDLPPGQYMLAAEILSPGETISIPVTVTAGIVTELLDVQPTCPLPSRDLYLPLVLKHWSH